MPQRLLFFALFFITHFGAYTNTSSNNHLFLNHLYQASFPDQTSFCCFSPYSIRTALLQLMLGALETTYLELTNSLYPKNFAPEFFLKKSPSKDHGYTAKNLCKIYLDQDEDPLELFSHHSQVFLEAQVEKIDFSQPGQASETINEWIRQETNKTIQEYTTPQELNASTAMYLVNTLYFQGYWTFPFTRDKTKPFFSTEGVKSLNFLTQKNVFNYFEDEKAQIVSLPLEKSQEQPPLHFVIFLPKKSTTPLKDALSYFENIQALPLKPSLLYIELPEFKRFFTLDLKKPLQKLGINEAFSSCANFSKINGKNNLMLSQVLHKCYINLNQYGLEASSASGAKVQYTAFEDRKKSVPFIANKPFAFMLADLSSNTPLFIGQFSYD